MISLLKSNSFYSSKEYLPIILGITLFNSIFIIDLTKMPHLLIAGATGQGKSVLLNNIIISIISKKNPYEVKLIIIDPKKVELSIYSKIKKYYNFFNKQEFVITDIYIIKKIFIKLCNEMDKRYTILNNNLKKNIKEYNKKFHFSDIKYLPYIIVIIDEFAELIINNNKIIEKCIIRLSQLSRAVGIHLVIATQRPSVNIISGSIKANFPSRIAFRVSSKIDSRTILDVSGAERLIGNGDMLFSINSAKMIRLQSPFLKTKEIEKILNFYISKLDKIFHN